VVGSLSDPQLLDLAGDDIIGAAVIQAGGFRAGMLGHALRDLDASAIRQVIRNARGAATSADCRLCGPRLPQPSVAGKIVCLEIGAAGHPISPGRRQSMHRSVRPIAPGLPRGMRRSRFRTAVAQLPLCAPAAPRREPRSFFAFQRVHTGLEFLNFRMPPSLKAAASRPHSESASGASVPLAGTAPGPPNKE
jgi:hypothetical protein